MRCGGYILGTDAPLDKYGDHEHALGWVLHIGVCACVVSSVDDFLLDIAPVRHFPYNCRIPMECMGSNPYARTMYAAWKRRGQADLAG